MEIWKDIKDYEGLYQVSNYGRVRSIGNGYTWKTVRILKQTKQKNGYMFVTLYKEGKQKHSYIHRLVAEVFVPNPYNLPQINHKDEDKSNNNFNNLEWCTSKYNNNYNNHNTNLSESLSKQPIMQYTLNGEFLKEWCSSMEIERVKNFSHSNIIACCRNKKRYKSAYGYLWKYKKDVV